MTVMKKKPERRKSALGRFLEKFLEALLSRRIERIPRLTYREAVRRLLEFRPETAGPVRGALVREPHREGIRLVFLYLDDQGSPMAETSSGHCQRVLIASSLDDELNECFGDDNVLIFG